MHEEIKARWIAKLRDPATIQGRSRLGKIDGSRCCLGVLCDIAVEDGVIPPPAVFDDILCYAGMPASPPSLVRDWADLPTGRDGIGTLIIMNDRDCVPFSGIADWIDANL